MVLGERSPGRVGRRRFLIGKSPPEGGLFFVGSVLDDATATTASRSGKAQAATAHTPRRAGEAEGARSTQAVGQPGPQGRGSHARRPPVQGRRGVSGSRPPRPRKRGVG